MNIPVKLIAGYNSKWNGHKWVQGGQLIVYLEDNRMLRIPRFALLQDYQPGERDIVLEVKMCGWYVEFEREEWKRGMKQAT